MEAYEVVSRRVERTGITVSELARRTGMQYMALRSTLQGDRAMKADEMLRLSRELGLDFEDFSEVA